MWQLDYSILVLALKFLLKYALSRSSVGCLFLPAIGVVGAIDERSQQSFLFELFILGLLQLSSVVFVRGIELLRGMKLQLTQQRCIY